MKKLIVYLSFVFVFSFLAPQILVEAGFEKDYSLYAQTKDQCAAQLDKAEEEYQAGKWTEAIELIEQCLKKENVGELERGRAYRILGLVYIAIQLEKEANDAVKNLLIMVPNYKVDPVKDPPSLQKIIDKMAETLNPKITVITPNTADQGDKGFKLTVKGSNFVYGSVVKFNGTAKSTTYKSDTELKTDDSRKLTYLNTGEYSITVFSPIMGGKTSNSEKFVVQYIITFSVDLDRYWWWCSCCSCRRSSYLGGKDDTETPPTLANPPIRPPSN